MASPRASFWKTKTVIVKELTTSLCPIAGASQREIRKRSSVLLPAKKRRGGRKGSRLQNCHRHFRMQSELFENSASDTSRLIHCVLFKARAGTGKSNLRRWKRSLRMLTIRLLQPPPKTQPKDFLTGRRKRKICNMQRCPSRPMAKSIFADQPIISIAMY